MIISQKKKTEERGCHTKINILFDTEISPKLVSVVIILVVNIHSYFYSLLICSSYVKLLHFLWALHCGRIIISTQSRWYGPKIKPWYFCDDNIFGDMKKYWKLFLFLSAQYWALLAVCLLSLYSTACFSVWGGEVCFLVTIVLHFLHNIVEIFFVTKPFPHYFSCSLFWN